MYIFMLYRLICYPNTSYKHIIQKPLKKRGSASSSKRAYSLPRLMTRVLTLVISWLTLLFYETIHNLCIDTIGSLYILGVPFHTYSCICSKKVSWCPAYPYLEYLTDRFPGMDPSKESIFWSCCSHFFIPPPRHFSPTSLSFARCFAFQLFHVS